MKSDFLQALEDPVPFRRRHIGPGKDDLTGMLRVLGVESLEELVNRAIPRHIRLGRALELPAPRSEFQALEDLRGLAAQNRLFRSFIGMGYSDCITPPVLQRNIVENPGWYTQYTPYQAEISQGRLEALLNFQTMISDLTGLPIANASLLDEATAAAEAMALCRAVKPGRNRFLVSNATHPQTIEVIRTRAASVGMELAVTHHEVFDFEGACGALVQYPDTFGAIHDFSGLAERAHAGGALLVVAADLLSLCLLRPPGEWGADVAVGSAQRFGVPLGYGGPHAAFFATVEVFKRQVPGRVVGVSKDSRGEPALRLALQTREQHIRREKATSNICTAQALPANMAAMYACYHGPEGLRRIARRVHALTFLLARGMERLGFEVRPELFFDTINVLLGEQARLEVLKVAERHRMNFRLIGTDTLGVSLDETTCGAEVMEILHVFNRDRAPGFAIEELAGDADLSFPAFCARKSAFLAHPVFTTYHTETEMLRYLKRLESRDLSLTTSMIPLGSCTMKLNAAVEMLPISWPQFSRVHPFAPLEQTRGYQELFRQLESWLAEITGFAGVSLQPNAGSQGEYAGLMAIRAYHASRGQGQRDVCLIPMSAHGTNPASAVMAGLKVVSVACDSDGNIDINDLRAKAQSFQEKLAALMVTYPSTHGVFEEGIKEICQLVHDHGGQVYMDGANLNALVGLCRPREIGADICHINLHKTFCIPHGGGGPGMGPIAAAGHLAEFLPGHPVVQVQGNSGRVGAVSAAPWGSASILPISWVYIAAMGGAGLAEATCCAILNANYIARRLETCFPVLYRGKQGFVAHECILDLRQFKSVTVEDVAKRLMDYGFHAPTISFPVPGTIMIEPTESESKGELDRFCEALIRIHGEIQAIESGRADKQNNLLKNAPHTADQAIADQWKYPYSREQACFPADWLREHKFWPPCSRIDNVYGDRNLVCTCPAVEAYMS